MRSHQLFFFLLLLFLPTQLGLHFWPDWTTVLGRRVDYLSPTLYLTDILVFFMLLFWFIQYCQSIKGFVLSIKGLISKILNTKYLILLILFVGLNIFFASSKPEALYKWLKVLEFMALGWYIIRTKPSLSFIIYPLSLGILYSSLLAVAQFFLQHSLGGFFWWLGERTFTINTLGISRIALNWSIGSIGLFDFGLKIRPYGTFPHPNVLGGFLAVTLPLVIIQLSNYPIVKLSNKKTLFSLTAIILGLVALILSFSRSAWVVGALGISIMYYVLRKKAHSNYFPIILYTVPLILIALLIFQGISPTDESVVVREQLNQAAIKLWQQSPIFGVGLGNFLVNLPEALPSRTVYFLQPVHNIYLMVVAETGLVGLALFLLLIWKSIKGLVLSIMEKNKKKSLIRNTYSLPLLLILFLGLVDHYPLTLQQGQLLFVLLLSLANQSS